MTRTTEGVTPAPAGSRPASRAIWLVPLCALPLFLSLPYFMGRVLLYRDLLHFNLPEQVFAAHALRALRLPEWDPGRYGGAPFFAEPGTGTLYPPNLVFQLFEPWRSATLFVLLHLPLAAAGTLLLARELGLSRQAAAIAAVGFAGSGYLLSMHGGHYYLASAALFPGAVALLLRARSPRGTAIAACGLALLIFNGELQAVAFAGIFALVLAPSRWLSIASAGALGGLLGAVQLLPTALFARETVRSAGLGIAEAGSWALRPMRWVEFLVALPFGVPWPENGYWGDASGAHHLPWAVSLYLGPALVVPALLAAPSRKRLAGLVCAALVLAAGPLTPLFALWLRLPLADRFRYPEKYALVATLALVLLGATGVEQLARGPRRQQFVAGLCFAGLVALFVTASAMAAAQPSWLTHAVAAGLSRAEANAPLPQALRQLMTSLLSAAAACASLALALVLARSRPAALAPLFLAVAVVSQASAGARTLSWGDGDFLGSPPELVQKIRASIPEGSAGRVFNDGSCAFRGGGQGSLLERRRQWDWLTGKENFLTLFGVREALGYGASEWRRQVSFVRSLDRETVPRRLGAALVLGCPRGMPELRAVADPVPRARIEGGHGTVRTVVDDAPERVRVEVEGGGGDLVLADTWAPGWSARIDGKAAEVTLADGIWRAVRVPAGAREVVFEYRTPGLRKGALATALALLLVAVLLSRPTAAGTGRG